jgi:phosphoenolpyruvate synthase/pyruvate phosphate dikinase
MKINWSDWQKWYNRPLTLNQAQFYCVSCSKGLKSILGYGLHTHLCIMREDSGDGYVDKKEWENFKNKMYKKFFNLNFLNFLNQQTLKQMRQIEKYFSTFQKIDFSKFNHKQLLAFLKPTVKILNHDISAIWVGFVVEEVANRKIVEVLNKYDLPLEKSLEIASSLDKPHHIIQEKIDLYKIALLKNKDQALQKHFLKYQHIPCYSVEIKPYDLEYFKKRLSEINSREAKIFLLKIKQYFNRKKEVFNKLLKSKKFLPIEKAVIRFFKEYAFLKDYRSHFRSIAMFNYGKFLKEIASRYKLDISDISKLLEQEIKELLQNKSLSPKLRKIIKARRSRTNVYWLKNNKDGVALFSNNLIQQEKKSVLELKGISANKGKAIGRVKIVYNPNNIFKVEKGDILVAPMTRPDYVVAMEKAAAIITDEGSLLCHAAIVSREMNKPCIVGTKEATSLLKDGDVVEVDADRGIVIKRN